MPETMSASAANQTALEQARDTQSENVRLSAKLFDRTWELIYALRRLERPRGWLCIREAGHRHRITATLDLRTHQAQPPLGDRLIYLCEDMLEEQRQVLNHLRTKYRGDDWHELDEADFEWLEARIPDWSNRGLEL